MKTELPILTPFHVLANPVGSLCNLNCKYCYYLEKEKLQSPNDPGTMTDELLERFVKEYIESQTGDVNFLWQGGEPTIAGLSFFRKVVQYQSVYRGTRRITNALQTNGTLLDDEFCQFLKKEDFLVGISVDGPPDLHDPLRRSKGGGDTLEQTLKGLSLLRKYGVEFNILCVVHRENSKEPLRVYEFLKEIGGRYIQFLPLVERHKEGSSDLALPTFQGKASLMESSVLAEDYGRFLIAVFDEWYKKDVGKVFVQLFDVTLENWLGLEPSLCIFRTTCGNALAIEKNGDVFACDHYVFPEHQLGNIFSNSLRELVDLPRQRAFGSAKQADLPQQCRSCHVYFACKGECPKNRFLITADGSTGLNYLCNGYMSFFEHVTPMMNHMASTIDSNFVPVVHPMRG